MTITGIGNSGVTSASMVAQGRKTDGASKAEKPVWNGKKAYTYLEDMGQAAINYGVQAKKYYTSKTMQDGAVSVEDLKKQISEYFPEYTFTDREPKDVVNGKHYLYIDKSQLQKMADDPAYRGKVFGLMDRELNTGREYTLTYSDGVNKTMHITGSVFSLCEANRKYAGADGIPYLGSGRSDSPGSSSDSHMQVRSMSFLYDNLDPAKAARKDRAAGAKTEAEKLAKKRAEDKKAAKKAEEKKAQKAQAEKVMREKREMKAEAEKERLEEMFEERAYAEALFPSDPYSVGTSTFDHFA